MKKRILVFVIGLLFLSLCLFCYLPSTAQNRSSSEDSGQEPAMPFSKQTDKPKAVLQMINDSKSSGADFEGRELFHIVQKPTLFDLIGMEKLIVSDHQRSVSVAGVREQEIRVNFENNFGTAQELSFRLLDGKLYTAIRRESEGFVRFAGDEFSWRGKISGANDWSGDVILTVKDRAVSGLIYSPDAVYEIVPQENFKHLLVQIDQSQFPPCAGAISEKPKTMGDYVKSLSDAQIALDDGSQIDVMIVYTASVRSALGGTTQAEAFAQQAVTTTNTVYQNSGIATRLRLVQTMEGSYADNGSGSTGLHWVANDATVAAARNTAKADMVALLTENATDVCGTAYLMTSVDPSFESLAFSLTQRTCAIGNLTFAHELGHNQACEHNPENAGQPSDLAYPYAYGHWDSSANFRTVMSYQDPCPNCPRIPYFSNPSIIYNGAPIGITNQRDNTRVINNTALTISQFRDSGAGANCASTPITVGQTLNGTLTTTDCRYPTGSSWYSDAYTFNGTAGQQIAITMTSSVFDTWLALQDPSGTELTFNNDGGGGTNSRIPAISGSYTLPSTGPYKIQAKSFSANATGSYTVVLTQPGVAGYDSVLKVPKCVGVGSLCDSGALLNGRDNMSGGSEPNQPNTINNSCADGTSGTYHSDESLDAIKVSTLDGSNFAPGKAVRIDVTLWAFSTSFNYLDLFYAADASNPNWIHLLTTQPTVTGSQTVTTTYQLPGGNLQAVRAVFRYQGTASPCGVVGNFDDHDDLIFSVGTTTSSTWTDTDIAVGADNQFRSMWNKTDGTLALWVVSGNGSFQATTYGPYSGWTAKAIAAGADNLMRVLWTNTNGSASLWVVAANGGFQTNVYGPYAGWTAADIGVGADNLRRILWTNTNGSIAVWVVAANGSFQAATYGPYAGWTARRIAAGADSKSRVLWTNSDGRVALWTINADGTFQASAYGPYSGWTGGDIGVGSDNKTRVLWNHSNGSVALWTVQLNGTTQVNTYGPYAGWTARSIAVGSDNQTRVLWNNTNGSAAQWVVASNGSFQSTLYGPY